MKYSKETANARKIGTELIIYDVFAANDAEMDFVIAELNGFHPMITNHVSDRIYFIISGEGEVFSDNQWESVVANDCIYIKKNTVHSIRGNLTYAIITAPPYEPGNETEVKLY